VGLISRAVEAIGIRTAAITHLPKLTNKIRTPRSLYLRFPLGRSFGKANEVEQQTKILLDLLECALYGEHESIKELPYRWNG
jgi:hypothetical protein